MNGKLKVLIGTICILGLSVFFGGACIQDIITPGYVSPIVKDYVDANDVPLPPHKQLLPWWTSLFDLKVLQMRIEFIHQYRQMDEGLRYNWSKNINQGFLSVSEAVGQKLFSPTGPVGMLLPTSLMGILGTFAGGRLIKSPREKELEKKLNGE